MKCGFSLEATNPSGSLLCVVGAANRLNGCLGYGTPKGEPFEESVGSGHCLAVSTIYVLPHL